MFRRNNNCGNNVGCRVANGPIDLPFLSRIRNKNFVLLITLACFVFYQCHLFVVFQSSSDYTKWFDGRRGSRNNNLVRNIINANEIINAVLFLFDMICRCFSAQG